MAMLGNNGAFLFVKVYGEEEGTKKIIEVNKHLDSIKDFSNLIREEDRMGYEIVLSHKYEYMKFHVAGMMNFFLDPGRFDIYNFLGIKEANNSGLLYTFIKDGYSGVLKFIFRQPAGIIVYLFVVFIVNIFLMISLINFIFVKKVNAVLKIFLFSLILYLCLFSGPLGTMRYKVHIIPLLLFTIPFLWEKIRTRLKKQKLPS
jgi:hypothetical protein